MFCSKCGTEVPNGSAFCFACGFALNPGAAPVDHEFENLLELARRARRGGNSEEAAKYYEMLLLKKPSFWESNYYSAYYKALCCKIKDISQAADNVTSAIKATVPLIQKNLSTAKEKCAALKEINDSSRALANMLSNAAENHYFGIAYSIREGYKSEYLNNLMKANELRLILGIVLALTFIVDDDVLANGGVQILKARVAAGEKNEIIQSVIQKHEARMAQRKAEEAQRLANEKKARIEAYWSAHPEEKASLEKEKEEYTANMEPYAKEHARITQEMAALTKARKEPGPCEKEQEQLKQERDKLVNEYASLGIFSGKRKKEINKKLAEISDKLQDLKIQISKEKDQREATFREEYQTLNKKYSQLTATIGKLKKHIDEIDEELTKDRV